MFDLQAGRDRPCASREPDARRPEIVAGDLQIGPIDPVAQSGPQGLQDGLLGRETNGQSFRLDPTARSGVVQLRLGEAARSETVAVLREHLGDPRDLDEIDSMTDNAHEPDATRGDGRMQRSTSPILRRDRDMTAEDHQRNAEAEFARDPVRVAVLTVSDSRTLDNDLSGDRIVEGIQTSGWRLVRRGLVTDDLEEMSRGLESLIGITTVEAILITGGTGLAPRDRTVDVVESRLDRTIPGYGERLRAISADAIGPAALLSRAIAGVVDRSGASSVVIFTMPGSPHGVDTAMRELVQPMLHHVVWHLRDTPADEQPLSP